jgi:hypothetical protein
MGCLFNAIIFAIYTVPYPADPPTHPDGLLNEQRRSVYGQPRALTFSGTPSQMAI